MPRWMFTSLVYDKREVGMERWLLALFLGIKQSLIRSTFLAIAEQDRPYHVIWDESGFAIGCALMQFDTDGAMRVICTLATAGWT